MKTGVLSLLLISLLSVNSKSVEINSSTPYSGGVVDVKNGDIYFSTGLKLIDRETSYLMLETDHMICPEDTGLYMSYALTQNSSIESDQDDMNTIVNTTWDQITSVDTTVRYLDSARDFNGKRVFGHYVYKFFADWTEGGGEFLTAHRGVSDVVISQDSSGNFIKWQITEVNAHKEFPDSADPDNPYGPQYRVVVDNIYLKWEIDSCGNGQFRSDPVSNSAVPHKMVSSSRCIQRDQQLIFPECESLSISLFKPNGQQIRMSDGAGNFIDLTGLGTGLYFAQIKSGSSVKSIRFTID